MKDLFPYNVLKPLYDILNAFFSLFFSYGDHFFYFVAVPYAAILIGFYGLWHRYRNHQFSQTSQSSQFLNRTYSLPQALNFFHYGLIIILGVHFLLIVFGLLVPSELAKFFADNEDFLMIFEIFLWSVTLGVIIGISVFILRRIFDSRIRKVTTKMDWLLYILLFIQINLGFLIATGYYSGATWYASSIVPWFTSLATLNFGANTEIIKSMSGFDGIIKFHALNGFVIVAILPYTKLIHFISFPYGYLFRKYQISIWYTKKKLFNKH